MKLRPADERDRAECVRLRCALWPGSSAERQELEMEVVSPEERGVLVLDRGEGRLGGFLEITVRHDVEGARQEEVAYVEAWYVEADLSLPEWGGALMEAAGRWARERGFVDLVGEAQPDDAAGIATYRAAGFRATSDPTKFLKELPRP